eukprot:CAMPEP_0182425828 /NCGR_PEP_ID=MMETSP1167-20130531/12316_1 /TAXON_ID=2988 /ORGANISM="Mallomonas Sp, Strain CCMP3275" /LENGTH=217 /DNA_ID=CAMNT_0024606847 /DNA_START=277 /DNA_END=927 /DNA_ORIENTATION=+
MILASCRTVFCYLAYEVWDPSTGLVTHSSLSADIISFHLLDDLSHLLFFSLSSLLTLFWAEVVYTAVDREGDAFRQSGLRLWISLTNAAAYCALLLSSAVEVDGVDREDTHYMHDPSAVAISVLYLTTALCLVYYTRAANTELRQVPVELEVRRQRTFHLDLLSGAVGTSLLLGAVAMIVFDNQSLTLGGVPLSLTLSLILLYFLLLEIFPLAVIIW